MDAREFTSLKFNWLDALAADQRIKPGAFKVGYCIMQHVNADTQIAFLSDEIIREKANLSIPQIKRHRRALQDAGWLTWNQRRSGNAYTPLYDMIDRLRDLLMTRKEERKLRQAERRLAHGTRSEGSSPAIPQIPTRRSPMSPQGRSPVIPLDSSPTSHIHSKDNTLGITHSKTGSPAEANLVGDVQSRGNDDEFYKILGQGNMEAGRKIVSLSSPLRIQFLRDELNRGRLDPSAVTAAIRAVKLRN